MQYGTRPRAGRVEEEVRQARSVELIAQKRLLDLHMRSQVCSLKYTHYLLSSLLGLRGWGRGLVGGSVH